MQVSKMIRLQGYDIDYVANKMGLSKASLSKSICKTGNPAIGKLRQIAELIGCDLADFFEDERKNKAESKEPIRTTDKIKLIMQSKGLSVTEVAKRMGVRPQSLSRSIHSGTNRIVTLKLIADAIGCDISDITDGVPEPSPALICPYCGKEIKADVTLHAREKKLVE